MCLDCCEDLWEPQGCDGAGDSVDWTTKTLCYFTVNTHLLSSLWLEKSASSCILSDNQDTTSKKDDLVAPGMGKTPWRTLGLSGR